MNKIRFIFLQKLAQRNHTQFVFPGMFKARKKTNYAPYSGNIDGESYWNCDSCHQLYNEKNSGIICRVF